MPGIGRRLAVRAGLAAGFVGALAGAACFSGQAAADPASNWHVGVYAPSGRALSMAEANGGTGTLAAFQFTSAPNTALLLDTQGSDRSVMGNISGRTVSATFTISGGDGFSYYNEQDACATPPSVRLFFETSNAGGFDPTHYWWANGVGFTQLADGTFTISATVDPGNWSDWNGQWGTTEPLGFAAAAANVTGIGLSFGGGCGFENGVGSAGATLSLTGFSVS